MEIKSLNTVFAESCYYKLTNRETDEESIVYCYENPDANNELGIGFNVADGGAWMPIWDISEKTKVEKLKIEVVGGNEMTASEAIFGLCAWLTTRKGKVVLGRKHNDGPIKELIKEFCETNKLDDLRENWTDYLTHPK